MLELLRSQTCLGQVLEGAHCEKSDTPTCPTELHQRVRTLPSTVIAKGVFFALRQSLPTLRGYYLFWQRWGLRAVGMATSQSARGPQQCAGTWLALIRVRWYSPRGRFVTIIAQPGTSMRACPGAHIRT
jgi:hypothetical protein